MTGTDSDMLRRLLQARWSCRGFLPDPLPRDEIEGAFADAQHVASWCNSQPWQVILCGADETARFAEALFEHSRTAPHASDIPFPASYDGVYRDRRRACGWQLYDAVGVERGDRAASAAQMRENYRFFGAPHMALITTPKALGSYGVLDCGAYVTAVLLALTARGIGSVAMASVAGFAPFVRQRFDIAEDRDLLCGIAFGRPDPEHPANAFRTHRAPPGDVIDWRP